MLPLECPTIFLITSLSSKSLGAFLSRQPLIFSLSTKTATVINRYDWTSLFSLSEVALSSITTWFALSLTDRLSVRKESTIRNRASAWLCDMWVANRWLMRPGQGSHTLSFRPLFLLLPTGGWLSRVRNTARPFASFHKICTLSHNP
jgi:hypothetical protein